MATYRLTIEYEGTRYRGWQEQKNARTIAGELRRVAEHILGRSVELSGAGRTDAGVHALEQVARLRAEKRMAPRELLRALNESLPADINIVSLREASDRFDPRRDAIARYYLYQISTRRTAFAKRFVWWVKDRLDLGPMKEACGSLVGRHDFSSFCETTDEERSNIVVVRQAEIRVDGDLILFRIGASHFLWKMVRRVVGTLVEVGRGSITVNDFNRLIESGSPKSSPGSFSTAAHTAPPSGLFLERVIYEKNDGPGALAAPFPVWRV